MYTQRPITAWNKSNLYATASVINSSVLHAPPPFPNGLRVAYCYDFQKYVLFFPHITNGSIPIILLCHVMQRRFDIFQSVVREYIIIQVQNTSHHKITIQKLYSRQSRMRIYFVSVLQKRIKRSKSVYSLTDFFGLLASIMLYRVKCPNIKLKGKTILCMRCHGFLSLSEL